MSVVITNVSTHDDAAGLNQYVVRINNQPVIARFDHVRSEGLAVCLEKAAAAVRRADEAEIAQAASLLAGQTEEGSHGR